MAKEELPRRHPPLARQRPQHHDPLHCQQNRRGLRRRIGQSDRPADRAPVADGRMRDLGQRARQQWHLGRDQVRRHQVRPARHRPDHQMPAVITDAPQLRQGPQIDQKLRHRHAEIHHRHQALPASQRHGPTIACRQRLQGVLDPPRSQIAELRRLHGTPLPGGRSPPAAPIPSCLSIYNLTARQHLASPFPSPEAGRRSGLSEITPASAPARAGRPPPHPRSPAACRPRRSSHRSGRAPRNRRCPRA